MRDLFNDAPVDSRARARVRERQAAQDAAAKEAARQERRANSIYRRLVRAVDALGSRLARIPEGEKAIVLLDVFHTACQWLQEAETSLGIAPEAPSVIHAGQLACLPFDGPAEERLEAGKVRTQEQLRCYVGAGQAGPALMMPAERVRYSAWCWGPTRLSTAAIDARHQAALNTLEEREALLGTDVPHKNESPAANGALPKELLK